MKILRNIPGGFKLIHSLQKMDHYLGDIAQLRAEGKNEEERALIADVEKQWVNRIIDIFDVKVNIQGRENIPEGACVFMANHQGYADIVVMLKAAEGKQIGFIAKDSLKKVPYIGKWVKAIHGIFIERGDTRSALRSIQAGISELENGFSMVIFPEGTRSQCHEMAAFKPGSFKLATKAKVPIVPVTIDGTPDIFEKRGIITRGTTVNMVIHPAIDTASLDRHEIANITHVVENTIKDTLETFE